MSESEADPLTELLDLPAETPRKRRWRREMGFVMLALGLAGLAILWSQRVSIANRIVAGQLKDLGLPATYTIQSVGTRHQVLTAIVIGDPAHPDLTVEKAIVDITPRFGLPTIDRVTLFRPRVFGTYRQARLSLGSLDRILFSGKQPTAGLPDLNLVLHDGRGRLDSDYGPIGIKADGTGNLRDGFSGMLAAVAPQLAVGTCKAGPASLFGAIRIVAARPRFTGPVRLTALDCPALGLSMRNAGLMLDATSGEQFDSATGKYGLETGAFGMAGNQLARTTGSGAFTFAKGDLTASFALKGLGLSTHYATADAVALDGLLRSRDHFAQLESEGTLDGKSLRPASALETSLAGAEKSTAGTLLSPIAAQIRAALMREGRGSTLASAFVWRQTGSLASIAIPRAAWRGASGSDLVALSRVQLIAGGKGGLRLSGNVATGGGGLPQIQGRVEQQGGGTTLMRFVMREYRAGDTRLTLPHLALVQRPGGETGFAGQARITGQLPGGRAENLVVPLDGTYSSRHGLAAWRHCTPVHFDRFAIANLSLERRDLVLCPGREGAILRSDARGTRVAAGTLSLNLGGNLGTTPIRLTSGAVGFAWPGALVARSIDVSLGPVTAATTLKIGELKAALGKVVTGTFRGTEMKLNAVPLDIFDASGNWRFGGGDLAISSGALRLEDRGVDDRFRPLVARDAALSLHSTEFKADALLREPRSDRVVLAAHIVHDLDTETGHADLDMPGIQFDRGLQPDTLTALALGVIANARGTVGGAGRIDWNSSKVTSTGRFHTDKLDFAAAFGPVTGTSGTVVFSDLLGLVTAPDQRLRIATINPGIEVDDGEVSFQLEPDSVLTVNGATWPFLDGTLELKPTRMVLGASEVRRFTMQVSGVDSAKFIERLQLANISATGIFDGALPLVFDQDGGRIEGGLLLARPPGGNVSYVGALSYENLGAMGNFAFQALRSIDYTKMSIAMDGDLEGELVTRVRFDGVKQGAGAKRNFITRRFANLPIQFNINLRAPFQKLLRSFKSLYDPTAVIDPRALGLVDKSGKPIPPAGSGTPDATARLPLPSAPKKIPDIQPSDSRSRP